MSRRVAWLLFGLAAALAPVAVVLGVIEQRRGHEIPSGRASELYVQMIASAVVLIVAAVGLLIARRESDNAIGWIFLGSASALGVLLVAYRYADLAEYSGESWVGGAWAAWLASWLIIVPVFVAPCLVAQLFPDGRPMDGRWPRLLRLSIGLAAYLAVSPMLQSGPTGAYPEVDNPLPLPGWVGAVLVDPVWGLAILGLLVTSLVSVVVRFRRSRGIERQQITWLALAACVGIVGLVGTFVFTSVVGWLSTLFSIVALAGFVLMPVAVAVAILRYRLYEIDRIVSRTLTYGVVSVLLVGAYAGLVLGGQALFSSFAGGSNLAIAVSTLVVAALFLPVRARVQRFVDRRFNRHRYDAQRTLEAFGGRLREQVELDALSSDLLGVVGETMQPAHTSLWLSEVSR